jgi:uncharacterized protein YciI
MKLAISIFLGIILSLCVFSQENDREFTYNQGDTTYLMKRYVFGLLMSGPNGNHDSITLAKIQNGHLAHLNKLTKMGKLVMSGPFEDGGLYRGILVFDVATLEEAIALESVDPAVRAGRLKLEVFQWWGAKGTQLP